MASNRIKGITIEIGGNTTNLEKSLGAVDHNLVTIQKDLQAVERRLKLDPTNTELLAQKHRLLADNVSEAAKRTKILEDAADGVLDAFSGMKLSNQQLKNFYLEMELSASDTKSAKKALEDFNREMGQVSGPAEDAAGEIAQVGSAAEDAGESMGGLEGFASGVSNSLGIANLAAAGMAVTLGEKLVDAAIAAAEWIWNLDEATEEYRMAMGKLNTAFETAGYSIETAQNAYQEFYNILGDTDTATEASQLLAQLISNEEDIAKWTEIAAGVYGTFGDSLPIEGLIEAANETAKTGKVTGVLADALNWVGMSEDEMNDALAQTSDEGKRAQLIMNNLGLAYEDAAESFEKNNQTLIEGREAQADMDAAMGELGQTIEDLKNHLLSLSGFSEIIRSIKDAIDGLKPVFEALEESGLIEKFSKIIDLVVKIYGEVAKLVSPIMTRDIEQLAFAFDAVIWVLERVLDVVEWVTQKVSDLINFFKELFGLSKQTPSVSIPESGSRSRNIQEEPYAFRAATAENLPYLAQGTVARPNSPFMAVIGDNTQEPEIVSPLSTIEQAVRNVVGDGGGQARNIRVTVNFTGSAAQLVRMLQPQIVAETNRLGPQYVT